MGFEQYVDSKPKQAEQFAPCSEFADGVASGINAAIDHACRNPLGSSAMFTGSMLGGALLGQASRANGLVGILGRGAASAFGVLALSEALRGVPLPDQFSAEELGRRVGVGTVNGAVAVCGGLLGATLGSQSLMGSPRIREWPGLAADIEHSFGDGIVYRSTTRGAELRLPHGETYRWRGQRPFFETQRTISGTELTTFGDGSELKVFPNRKVEFIGREMGNKLKLQSDLITNTHVAEYDRLIDGKSRMREWERIYRFSDGTSFIQHPSRFEIMHPRGWAFEVPLESKLKRGRIHELPDGAQRAVFDKNTELLIDKDGQVHLKAVMWKSFD